MSRLTLRLPETLHQQLANLAEGEGVSLNQYIVYALTRQVTLAYSVSSVPKEKIQRQQQSFNSLLQELGKASASEMTAALAEREMAPPEKELDADTIALFQQRIQDFAKVSSQVDSDDTIAASQRSDFLDRWSMAPAGERRTLLIEHLRLQISKVLELSSPSQVDVQENFFNLGMNSLMAVELHNRLQNSFNCSIPISTLAFEYPTVEDLADYLASEVLSVTSHPEADTTSSNISPA